ncbi:hypothetical protein LRP67_15885 [Nocardioides sp. cx-169]|uniref:hypothetical protein n=1 Tax=Nocardioides sp. cx-169 TaxID=2899080 RepID=UPI001E3E63B9|nr:hypothetical protein [Nocardioides sp. cx-169]MCD4535572.1 hypothetical protein [Nocardioides sp. cx-169]
MRNDVDFSAYALARWPSLVRSLVLLGVPAAEASDVGVTVLARLRGDWRRRDELGDLAEHTFRVLLDALHDAAGRWQGHAVDGELEPLDPGWPELRARLDQLGETQRAAVVLPVTAGLGDDQVGWLLGDAGAVPARDLAEEIRRAADSIPVPPLLLADVAARQRVDRRARQRRLARRSALALAVLAVFAGAWTWWAERPDPPAGLADVEAERLENPVGVGWYSDDTLRLDRVALGIEGLESFVQLEQGAVYAATDGSLVLVDTEGDRTLLGRQDRDGAFAASAVDGLVAWVQTGGGDDDAAELRVLDVASGELVAAAPVREPARVIAVDAGVVYVEDAAGFSSLQAGAGNPGALVLMGRPGLLDAAGPTLVYQLPGAVEISRIGAGSGTVVPGFGGQLSPEGDYLLTREGGPEGPVRIFDTLDGTEVDTGLAPGAEVLAANLDRRGVATYFVGRPSADPDEGLRISSAGSVLVVTCPLSDLVAQVTCTTRVSFPRILPSALAH